MILEFPSEIGFECHSIPATGELHREAFTICKLLSDEIHFSLGIAGLLIAISIMMLVIMILVTTLY